MSSAESNRDGGHSELALLAREGNTKYELVTACSNARSFLVRLLFRFSLWRVLQSYSVHLTPERNASTEMRTNRTDAQEKGRNALNLALFERNMSKVVDCRCAEVIPQCCYFPTEQTEGTILRR
jgi:hypothetical protein